MGLWLTYHEFEPSVTKEPLYRGSRCTLNPVEAQTSFRWCGGDTDHYTTEDKNACRNPGSNQGPLDLQSNALPTELFRHGRGRIDKDFHEKMPFPLSLCGYQYGDQGRGKDLVSGTVVAHAGVPYQ
ncbi:hypothetical protein TNCV_3555051 [Trichonephila clavipes]|nr:hypothetical protein TNCV_3555051 [Trichonephila clavipes]